MSHRRRRQRLSWQESAHGRWLSWLIQAGGVSTASYSNPTHPPTHPRVVLGEAHQDGAADLRGRDDHQVDCDGEKFYKTSSCSTKRLGKIVLC